MTLSIPDEFDSNVGELTGYTGLKGGYVSLVNSLGVQVDGPVPTPETDTLDIQLANRHVDIRSMITTDPDHGRPMRDMNLLHMMENAYHQSINSIGDAPTGGTWNLTWEDTGPTEYVLTDDYIVTHASSILCTITRVALGDIASGEVVHVSYSTTVGSYENEAVTMTGVVAQSLAHQADNVDVSTIVVTKLSNVLTSADIDWDAPGPGGVTGDGSVQTAIQEFIPQVIDSLAFAPDRPAVVVTGATFPYIVTFQDETVAFPLEVREIGSWAALFGVDDSGLTSGGTPELSISNLRTDVNWLQSADIDDSLTMEEIETVPGSVNENWSDVVGSTGVTSVTVDRDPDYFNWRSMKVVFDGSPVLLDLTSSTPLTPVNIIELNADRSQTFINFVVPEWTSGGYEADPKLDLANSFVQFTSDDNGLFAYQGGTGITDSDEVPLDGNMDATFFQAVLTDFGVDTDWSRITAVRIHLESSGGDDPDAADVLTFMAVRALDNNWNLLALDVNTRTGHIESPVSLDGDPNEILVSPVIRSINATATDPDFVSDNVTGDPSLVDGTVSIKFNSGSQVHHGAITEPSNHIVVYLRQRVVEGDWDWIQAQLSWGWNGSAIVMYMAAAKGASDGTTSTLSEITLMDAGPDLAVNTDYLFSADISDEILSLSISTVDSEGRTTDFYTPNPIEDTNNFVRVRGRVGWYAEMFKDKDVELDYIRSSNISFATMRTAVFHSRTPVDGAQLFVTASEPSQLFTEFSLTNTPTGADTDDQLLVDTTKKLSATSSTRFIGGGLNDYSGIQTNIIDFDDWNQMFLDFDVWMPASLSAHNNVQEVRIAGSPSAGVFRLTHDGAETADIAYNATAFQVQTALAALGTIGAGNVLCTNGPLPTAITIKFIDGLEGADISTLEITATSIVGGTPEVTQVGVRPQIFFKDPETLGDYTVGTIGPFTVPFVPGTWSHVHIDLRLLANHAVNPYHVQILTQQPSAQSFWVDNFKAAHRSIAWELRAIENGDWYPFLDTINDPTGALHLPPEARGKALQIQARALREDAWISNYTLKPHYAPTGRLIGLPSPYLDIHDVGARVVSVPSGVEEYFDAP